MRTSTLFLNHHADIHNAILLLGYEYNKEFVRELFNQVRFERLIVTGSFSHLDLNEIKILIEDLSEKNYDHLSESYFVPLEGIMEYLPNADALIFDGVDNILYLHGFSNVKIKYLVGNVNENSISSFDIWELFRKTTSHIIVETQRMNRAEQVLNWEKDESNDVELSVIFPVYKVEKYIEKCLETVTAWNAEYVEFLFVNDGSPDRSKELIEKWAVKDPRIKIINKENGGCASARQCGLEAAKGRYIGFVDPDDFVDKTMFHKLLMNAMRGSYDICFCGYNEYYETDQSIVKVTDDIYWPFTDGVTDPLIIQSLIAFARVAIWRGVYKKKMIVDAGIHFYTDLKRFDDLPFKVEVFAAAKAVYAIPETLYYYRLQRPGQDVSARDERLFVHFEIFEHLNQRFYNTKNQRLIDWLQLCKLQTHRYALNVIEDSLCEEYVKRAKKDLDSTGGRMKSFTMIRYQLGRKAALYYLAIQNCSPRAIRILGKSKRL